MEGQNADTTHSVVLGTTDRHIGYKEITNHWVV